MIKFIKLYFWNKRLCKAIDKLLINKDQTADIKPFKIGEIDKNTKSMLQNEFKIILKNKNIFLTKTRILHFRPERKAKFNQDISEAEIKQIAKILADNTTPKTLDKTTKTLNYWHYKDEYLDKIFRISLQVNYKIDKNTTNILITICKVSKKAFNEKNKI